MPRTLAQVTAQTPAISLLGAPIAERRRWVSQVAPRLYNLQKARFGYISQGQSRERKLAWNLVKLQKGPAYITAIARTIVSLKNTKHLNKLWEQLLDAEEEQDFARIVGESRPGTPAGDYIEVNQIDEGRVSRMANRLADAIHEGKLLTGNELARELSRYATGFSSFSIYNTIIQTGFHTWDNRMINIQSVPCVLGALPLRHIQSIEIARSGKILKFRATGTVFLANQEGGEDGVRIEGIIVRAEVLFILFLWALFLYGQGRVKEIESFDNISLLAMRTKQFDITKYNATIEKPSYEHHMTFPFVTRHIIMPNCFIETLSFEEKVVFGKDVIGYTILLRTYRKPIGFDIYSVSSGLSLFAPKGNKFLNMYKILEFSANATWRYINANGIFIDEREWKVGMDGAGSDDVYYDVDPMSLASSVMLGVFGIL